MNIIKMLLIITGILSWCAMAYLALWFFSIFWEGVEYEKEHAKKSIKEVK